MKNLPNRRDNAGECSLLRVVASFPARPEFAEEQHWEGDKHPIASLNMEFVKKMTKDKSPLNILENHERVWKSMGQAPKRMRDSEPVSSVGKRRKTMEAEDSDASESSSVKSAGSQKRERDTDDSESGDGREKKRKVDAEQGLDSAARSRNKMPNGDGREDKRKTLDVHDTKLEFLNSAARRRSEKLIIPSAAMVAKKKGRRWRFRK